MGKQGQWLMQFLARFVSEPTEENIFLEETYAELDKKVEGSACNCMYAPL